jgi:Calcineurin-like phosphoesterase
MSGSGRFVPPLEHSPRSIGHPVFGQPLPTADPARFRIRHPSDNEAYREIDELNREHAIKPLPFPAPRGLPEPHLTLEEVFGGNSAAINNIERSGQLVFHSTGDCGSTRGPGSQNEVTDKMVADFNESDPKEIPQFNMLLGDIVYSFGEAQYYYDQFYEPYRNYPAPILAVAGNHDGMISPLAHAESLAAYLRNFCAEPGSFIVSPDAGGLSRTAQIQPGVFFTFEAPFVRIVALYANILEDPGVIANPEIGKSQLDFIEAALTRIKHERYEGALLFATHHPPYTAGSVHGWSIEMLSQIDEICERVGVLPHAFISGHAHNYQRFTRTRSDGAQIPYLVCGNGGHALARISKTKHGKTLRTPQIIQPRHGKTDQVVFENYDDQDYGYLRVVVNSVQLRIEYHPASDGAEAKTADDFVTVDLKNHRIGHFSATDLGRESELAEIRRDATASHRPRHQG